MYSSKFHMYSQCTSCTLCKTNNSEIIVRMHFNYNILFSFFTYHVIIK